MLALENMRPTETVQQQQTTNKKRGAVMSIHISNEWVNSSKAAGALPICTEVILNEVEVSSMSRLREERERVSVETKEKGKKMDKKKKKVYLTNFVSLRGMKTPSTLSSRSSAGS